MDFKIGDVIKSILSDTEWKVIAHGNRCYQLKSGDDIEYLPYDDFSLRLFYKVEPKTKTNFDKIREMSAEEFAKWCLIHDFCLCPDEACKNGIDCEKCLTKWLNSPANPEHLNGKFVCTSADPEESYTPGKVYTFTNGRTIDDYGKTRPDEQYAPIDNIEDYNRATANFILCVGGAND